MAAKKKGLAKLIGKQVQVKLYYEKESRGVFTFLDLDNPMVELGLNGSTFWWNLKDIEAFHEIKEEATVAK